MNNVRTILELRQQRYGSFYANADTAQLLKQAMKSLDGWEKLQVDQCEALEMIAHKIARILNGDPNYEDSWIDIAGYAKLVADRLQGVEE
jgi:hypothetical protein